MIEMDDEKISLRISKEELQAMDRYLEEHPEEGSRSHFIKNAIRMSLNRDAQATTDIGNMEIVGDDGVIHVKLPRVLQASVDSVVGEMYLSHSEYIRALILKDLDADGQKAKDLRERAVFAATSGISP